MEKRRNSLVDLDIEDSTVYNQTPRKLSNQSQNDMNSSLIFGNEITSKSIETQHDGIEGKQFRIGDRSNENMIGKPILAKEAPSQNDTTFELLQNPNNTPFLSKLKDPFDDTYNESLQKLSIETPLNKKIGSQFDYSNQLQSKVTQKYNFETLRNEADNSCLEYETQGNETIFGNDTNGIPNDADTQVVNISEYDTLKFAANANKLRKSNEFTFNEETQIDSNKQNYHLENDTQIISKKLDDTQIISKKLDDTQIINQKLDDTQIINQKLDDTQIINQRLADTQAISPLAQKENAITSTKQETNQDSVTSSSSQNAIQIPSTIEKPSFPRPQVVNTQEEEPDSTPSNMKVDLSTRPVYSSSQRSAVEEEEVRTDDEKDNGRINQQGLYYDDSLLTHHLKRKRRLSDSESSIEKAMKISPNKDVSETMNKPAPLNNMSKTPLSLKNKHYNQIAFSPCEIDESSPGIKRADILVFPSKSSPQNDNIASNANNGGVNEISAQANLPSSPTKERSRLEMEMKFPKVKGSELKEIVKESEINSENNSSELEDIDLEHFDNDINDSLPNTRRKGRSITVTSSQSQDGLNVHKDSSSVTAIDIEVDDVEQEKGGLGNMLMEENSKALTKSDIHYMESVWVSFKFNMYTGKITRVGHENSIVEFEEGSYSIKNSDLYLLDIRIGDKLRTRSSKYKFVVTGLAHRENGEDIKCIRGFNLVSLRRLSKAKGKKFEELETSLSECYMELSDWIHHQQTFQFLLDGQDILKQDAANIFLNCPSLSTNRIPSRSTRFSNTPEVIEYDLKYRNGPISSPSRKNESKIINGGTLTKLGSNGLFSGMVFCLTFGKSIDEDKKDKVRTAIENNGGSLLDEGLHHILQYCKNENGSLKLQSPVLSEFSFGAVISNTFCRSAKYLQALALGWPILSDYYIFDCIKDNKRLTEWPVYLLPAGQSKFLSSVKSLEIFKFRQNYESNKELSQQLKNNNHLLQDVFIIIINNKANSKTLQTCEFIFYAFGAKSLRYCSSVSEIANVIEECGDVSILVYDNNETIKQDMKVLKSEIIGGTRTRSQSRTNRKQTSEARLSIATTKEKNIGFINWEWVVQCVISGYIWDPEYI